MKTQRFDFKGFKVNNSLDLSIVIPVYNLQNYIDRCIESVIGYNDLKLEVILIDDGSTDNSPGICDEYATKYNFIKVIHKQNEGASEARNAGIRIAAADYVMFIDGDDFLVDGIINDIIGNLDGETELYTFNYFDYYETGKERNKVIHLVPSRLFDKNSNITRDIFYSVPALPMPWLYVMKREYILNNNLFMKIGILDEDEEWSARVFANLNKAKILDIYAYNYRRNRENSLTFGRRFANILADLDIIYILRDEAKKDRYDKRQKHILHNKCRQLIIKIQNEKAMQTKENQTIIKKRLKYFRSMLLGGSKAEVCMYFLSQVFDWNKAKKIVQKAVDLKSNDRG